MLERPGMEREPDDSNVVSIDDAAKASASKVIFVDFPTGWI